VVRRVEEAAAQVGVASGVAVTTAEATSSWTAVIVPSAPIVTAPWRTGSQPSPRWPSEKELTSVFRPRFTTAAPAEASAWTVDAGCSATAAAGAETAAAPPVPWEVRPQQCYSTERRRLRPVSEDASITSTAAMAMEMIHLIQSTPLVWATPRAPLT
jgi:hypothetical protein